MLPNKLLIIPFIIQKWSVLQKYCIFANNIVLSFFWQAQQLKGLAKEICDVLSPVKSFHLPPLSRGAAINTYYPTVDDLLIQYDFDRYLFKLLISKYM